MSAGMSCQITIKFIPQINQDIFDAFPLLSETGPINIPIECTYKKAIVTIEETTIDFDKVIFGEQGTKVLKLVNSGALATDVYIKNLKGANLAAKSVSTSSYGRSRSKKTMTEKDDDDEDDDSKNFEKQLQQLQFAKVFRIEGYSSYSLPFTYKPSEISSLDLPLIVYFDNFMHSPQINITIKYTKPVHF
jgi:hypothetical protein